MTTLFALDRTGKTPTSGTYTVFDSQGRIVRTGGRVLGGAQNTNAGRRRYIEAYCKGQIVINAKDDVVIKPQLAYKISEGIQKIINEFGRDWTLDYCSKWELDCASLEFQKAYIKMRAFNT